LIEAANEAAVSGSRAYGTIVHPSVFDPLCDAYAPLPNGKTYFNGTSLEDDKFIRLVFAELKHAERFPYPVSLFKNITNQPSFSNGSVCDQQIRFFNTSVTTGLYEPTLVKGTVESNLGPFRTRTKFQQVLGMQVATAFAENNYLSCDMFKGYELPPDF
jgi:hypothetical protein